MTRLQRLASEVIKNAVEESVDLVGVMEQHEDEGITEDDARIVLALVRAARVVVVWDGDQ